MPVGRLVDIQVDGVVAGISSIGFVRKTGQFFNEYLILHLVDVQWDLVHWIEVGWMLLPDSSIPINDALADCVAHHVSQRRYMGGIQERKRQELSNVVALVGEEGSHCRSDSLLKELGRNMGVRLELVLDWTADSKDTGKLGVSRQLVGTDIPVDNTASATCPASSDLDLSTGASVLTTPSCWKLSQ
jgi:hypothetical protein